MVFMLKISEDCIHCGRCAQDCPAYIISLESGDPAIVNQERCIACGHCEAVCPFGALHHEALNHDNCLELEDIPTLDCDTAEIFLRSRRSVRNFQNRKVSQEETQKLLNIGRYAQTGSNKQGVSYLVISDEDTLRELRRLTLEFYAAQAEPIFQMLHAALADPSHDLLLREAPMIILALTQRDQAYTVRHAQFALTYLELYAPSLGLGTCWAGYLERYVTSGCEKLQALLKLPEQYVISGALLFGYPPYPYHRLVGRDPLDVLWR